MFCYYLSSISTLTSSSKVSGIRITSYFVSSGISFLCSFFKPFKPIITHNINRYFISSSIWSYLYSFV